MRLGTLSVLVVAILLAGCAQKKTISRRSVKSPTASSSSKAPAAAPTAVAKNAPTRAAKEDGPLLAVVVKGTVELAVAGKSPGKPPAQKINNLTVIKSILSKVKLQQRLKANRKPCPFVISFLLNGAGGSNIGMLAVCTAKSTRAWPGTFIATRKGKKHQTEWGITIPDGPALKALVQKHLPAAVGASKSDVPIVKDAPQKTAAPAAKGGEPKKGATVTKGEAPGKTAPPATGKSKVVPRPAVKDTTTKMKPPPPPKVGDKTKQHPPAKEDRAATKGAATKK